MSTFVGGGDVDAFEQQRLIQWNKNNKQMLVSALETVTQARLAMLSKSDRPTTASSGRGATSVGSAPNSSFNQGNSTDTSKLNLSVDNQNGMELKLRDYERMLAENHHHDAILDIIISKGGS